MLTYVTLKNFKCFDEQDFALGNLTLIAGANGAGKSTLIQALTISFRANNPQQAEPPKKQGLSKGVKWGIGIGIAIIGGIIYCASKGKVKPSSNGRINNQINNIQKVILPKNISAQTFTTKEEAINFAKNTLKINKIDDTMSLEALNDSINSIIKVSNKNGGQLFMPPELKFLQGKGDFTAKVITNISKSDFGTLAINSSLYNMSELDSMLCSEKWSKFLYTHDGIPLFTFKDGKLINSPRFNNITMQPDEKLSNLLKKYYKKEVMTIKEKQKLLLSLSNMVSDATLVKTAPINILEKVHMQHHEFLAQNGIEINLKNLATKSIEEQSAELSKILEKLVNNKKNVSINCSTSSIEDAIFHEFGHLQDIGLNKELVLNTTEFAKRFSTRQYFNDVLLKKYSDFKLPTFITNATEQNTAGKVSSYATSGIGEFIAETYAKLIKGEKLPDDVMLLYKKYNGPSIS